MHDTDEELRKEQERKEEEERKFEEALDAAYEEESRKQERPISRMDFALGFYA